MKQYVAKFDIKGVEGTIFERYPFFKEHLINVYVNAYDIYCDKANGGVTDQLNKDFDRLYPSYHEDNKDKEWYEMKEYNQFMADGYMRLIVDDINKAVGVYPIICGKMDFYVEPEEVQFKGRLISSEGTITIGFHLEEE